ncbi:MAG: SMC-Scp complex subunit ScpB, partial [Terriglobus sp.]
YDGIHREGGDICQNALQPAHSPSLPLLGCGKIQVHCFEAASAILRNDETPTSERMSLKSKIEAVIYASEEPVTLAQLVGLLAGEAQDELDVIAADQAKLPLDEDSAVSSSESVDDDMITAETIEELQANAEAVVADNSVPVETEPETTPDPPAVETSEPVQEPETAVSEHMSEETLDAAPADAPETDSEEDKRIQREREKAVRDHIRRTVDGLIREYAESDRGIEIREVASGFRMGTKPEFHDAVRGFVKSLKPPLKLTLPALETLAVVAYKQPVTAAEISEIRGVDSAGVLGGLMTRKLIATAGRKQVIGRPMLYKTTRDFLLRFGLKDVNELPSMEEFERMAGELAEQEDLPMESSDAIIEEANARGDAEMLREMNEQSAEAAETAETEEAEVTDESTDGETETVEASAPNEDQQEATAETAAGGNDEIREEADTPETRSAEEHTEEESKAEHGL